METARVAVARRALRRPWQRGGGVLRQAPTRPAQFYWLSYPAQADHPCTLVRGDEEVCVSLGSVRDANRRTIYKYIHPGRVASSQIVMGITRLEEGSVWNTMPPHTHPRRSGDVPVLRFGRRCGRVPFPGHRGADAARGGPQSPGGALAKLVDALAGSALAATASSGAWAARTRSSATSIPSL